MLEEHHKLIVDLQIGNDDVQNEHSKVVKDEGDLLVKKNYAENKLSRLKSQIPLMSRKIESRMMDCLI